MPARVRFPHVPSRRRKPAEAGFTLIELLVVTALLSVVVAALTAPLVFSINQQTNNVNYSFAQQEARTSLESMVTQIRQADKMITRLYCGGTCTTNTIDMLVSLNGTLLRVDYECDITQPNTNSAYRECVRAQTAATSPTPPSMSTGVVVARNLLNGTNTDPVFTLGPNAASPNYMTATLKLPASGGSSAQKAGETTLHHQIVFTDGALMRSINAVCDGIIC
jgi:prepilin-type N-terminal cleavage/methylation domain-containing protein